MVRMPGDVSGIQQGTIIPEKTLPQVAFLGFAERSEQVRDAETVALKWNVLGLKNVLLLNFLPIPLNGWKVGIALRFFDLSKPLKITLRAESGEEIGFFNLQIVKDNPTPESLIALSTSYGWFVAFVAFPSTPPLVIQKQGRHFAILQRDDNCEDIIGEFYCAVVDPPPLTPERIAAIKSHPKGIKAVRAVFGCAICPSKVQPYAALERDLGLEAEGFKWYADIPEHFTCECGKTQLDFGSLKRNFFALLLQPMPPSGEVSCVPLYEKSSVENLRLEFLNLVSRDPLEEELQKFIEENPLLLHQFPAEKLFFKPQILTQFKADFAIVTPQKELVLIEIERASTRLLKSDGGQHSDLTHAIDQVHNWLGVTGDHLLAVLDDSLHVPREMVSTVRGVVIAGRDLGNNANHLRALKARYRGEIRFLTYDDLAAALAVLAQSLGGR